jgi:hypothetical protein
MLVRASLRAQVASSAGDESRHSHDDDAAMDRHIAEPQARTSLATIRSAGEAGSQSVSSVTVPKGSCSGSSQLLGIKMRARRAVM